MKENTNLVIKTPEELSPEQEKEILSLIKAEASSFVPDKLLSVLKACGIESEVSEEDEAFVLGMLKGNSFVPDDKAALEKTTGVIAPDLKKDEKALTRRMRREANAFVPNKKREIYNKTGLKEHFSFARFMKKNWAFVGAGAAAIAGISIGANAYLNNREIVNAALLDDIKAAGVEVITPTPEAFEGFKSADATYRDAKIAEWGDEAIFAEALDYVANNTK